MHHCVAGWLGGSVDRLVDDRTVSGCLCGYNVHVLLDGQMKKGWCVGGWVSGEIYG